MWEILLSTSKGVPYYYNSDDKTSRWSPPPELSEEEIKKLPGAEHLNPTSEVVRKEGQIRASHLLVKHEGSRRPSSWKEKTITRTKDEAIAILEKYQKEIDGSAEKFRELASRHSDCSSHEHGGELGWFGRGAMQKPFEDAAFALEVGQISGIVDTGSGVHLIMRTG